MAEKKEYTHLDSYHFFKWRSYAKVKHNNAGRESGPWFVQNAVNSSFFRRYAVMYKRKA